MRILALTRYSSRAASTRQRFEQYIPALGEAGIELTVSPLFGDSHVAALELDDRPSVFYYAAAYARRAARLLNMGRFDLVWVHCELFPYLPGLLEAAGARLATRRIVYDFDDAIFHQYEGHSAPLVRGLLAEKLEPLLRRSLAATCGNEYLRAYAGRFCPRTMVLPTVVDTDVYVPSDRDGEGRLTIGWIGSPSTWNNVRPLLPLLRRICASGKAKFRVVGAGVQAHRDRFSGMDLVEWRRDTEVAEVQRFDVGIMPLTDAPFQRGKSGYKLIQYMACGVPAIGSPVGVNSAILEGCGLVATTEEEWSDALNLLIEQPELRQRLGELGRERVVQDYSLQVHAPRLVGLFKSLLEPSHRRLKLLFVIKSLTATGGGAERVLALITRALIERGHEVTIATFDPEGSAPFYPFDRRVRLIGLGLGDARSPTRFGEGLARARILRRLARREKPDVAIGFMHSAYVPLAMGLATTGIPVIASEHIVYSHYHDRVVERFLLAGVAPFTRTFTAISEPMRRGFPARIRGKMQIIGNPVAPPERTADPVGNEPKLILCVGRLEPQKDHATLIAAFGRIADRFPQWRLRIVGEGHLRRELEAQIGELGLAGRIELPGAAADVAAEYSAAQLFVLPSRYESFGLATAEAMSSGLPVIGFADCPGTNEIINDGVDGLLVRGEDRVEELGLAMSRLMDGPEERKRMGAAALRSSMLPTIDSVADDWERLVLATAKGQA